MYINLNIEKYDNLPLLSEERKIFDITRAYLHLPYSVAEYGCGKRADITTKQLFDLGISPNAIRYGMIIEPDMSAQSLAEFDHTLRPSALHVDNPLASLIDFNDAILLDKIEKIGATIDMQNRTIAMPPYYSGEYVLHSEAEIGFNLARSHVFLIIHFYDLQSARVVQRVLDPMLDPTGMFDPQEIRRMLSCPQGVLFSSSIGGYFAIVEEFLTAAQKEKLSFILDGRKLDELDKDQRRAVVRIFLNNAPEGSIGDPETWTYDNNLRDSDLTYNEDLSKEDLEERHERMAQEIIPTDEETRKMLVNNIASWSEEKLLPLANLVNCIRVHKSEIVLRRLLREYEDCAHALLDNALLDELRGFGVRLRQRIDQMAEISKNKYNEIDARTFTTAFIEATIELIKQMNRAGMLVFIDKVGNVHGVLADRSTKQELRKGFLDIESVTSKALGFHSHIDTVYDAGKYDGRLGVLSGLEIAHTLFDLSIQDAAFEEKLKNCPVLVSAYVNEEMTYTGKEVSMPGSSAVAGLACVEDIYQMTEPGGGIYKEGLDLLIKRLTVEQKASTIDLAHRLTAETNNLFEPAKFLPKQSIERHCEQADIILKSKIPMTQVNVILGIFQEDFKIAGNKAEQGALKLVRYFHILNHDENKSFKMMRITNGALRKEDNYSTMKTEFAQHFILYGKKDHAGATALDDRFDPAVAASKLCDAFYRIIEAINRRQDINLQPVIGDFNLYAKYSNDIKIKSVARNAIADVATISLAIDGPAASAEIWSEIFNLVRDELNANTKMYGDFDKKDLYHWESIEVDQVNVYQEVVLTLDVRYPDTENMEVFLLEKKASVDTVQREFSVVIENSIEQQLAPQHLDKEKNVSLILDGSIGGSHNPHEAEYPEVVLAGTILQLAATLKFMNHPDKKIFDIVEDCLPRKWREKIRNFNSGALHDACQIATGISRRINELENI